MNVFDCGSQLLKFEVKHTQLIDGLVNVFVQFCVFVFDLWVASLKVFWQGKDFPTYKSINPCCTLCVSTAIAMTDIITIIYAVTVPPLLFLPTVILLIEIGAVLTDK